MAELLLGITTPVVTMLPRAHASWEATAGIEEIATVVTAADRLGYHHATCSEHVVIPTPVAEVRGGRYWDPLATFGYLAAVTQRIHFTTNVLVLGYHHPLEIAKRYGTLDRVCGGRLVLGLGVGSLQEEFELLGVPFADRGARADEALEALRGSLGQERPVFHGRFYDYEGMLVDPCAVQASPPLWIGGRTARSLRRAIELGDGWMPFGLGADDLGAFIAKAKQTPAWERRRQPFHLVLTNGRPIDPAGDPDGARHVVDRLTAAGATALQLRFVHQSPSHYVEQLEAMLGLVQS